jgi:hypothetical protein
MLRFRSVGLFAALGVVMAFPAGADASLQVTLTAGATSVTVMDNMPGDASPLMNQIGIVSLTVSGYTFTFTLSSTNSPGSPAEAFLDASTGSISGSGATTLSIYANSTGFTAPTTPPVIVASSGSTATYLGGSTPGNSAGVSYSALIDTTNAATTAPAGTVVGSGSDVISAPAGNTNLMDFTLIPSLSSPYAMNLFLSATVGAGVNNIDLDGTFRLAPVPEPGAIVVWALLSVFGVTAYRKLAR